MKKSIYKVIIIDDHPLFRKGVTELLNSEKDFKVIGEATSGAAGIDLALTLKPDLILIDLNMKDMNGIAVLAALKKAKMPAKSIILTVSDTEQNFITAIKTGADGYLLKDAEPELMIEKLRQAINGEVVIDDNMTNFLTHFVRNNTPQTPSSYNCLSVREIEIIKLIAKGMSNKLIARNLDITEGTVKVHVKNMLRKLKLSSRLEAALWAIKNNCTD